MVGFNQTVTGNPSPGWKATSNPVSDPVTGIGGTMEPLVVFGAGLVIYCGYLAAIDEIRDLKKCCAKRRASCRAGTAKVAKKAARPVAARGGAYAGNSAYSRGGRLLVPQAR